ncbi:retinoblastoma-associated protein-like isoform X2 [Pomacea canaliculata]|nr:retinoblastoma-associated protein-like isoform X2 [Pomacea canaliculata]XP_025079136.1 retinoblastoma-associated protein-like isoform X2 [Pomacea canaliculata]
MPLFQHNQDFSTLCISLSVPVDIQKKAEGILETLWTELDQQEDIEMHLKDMFVCVLYMALIDARMPYGPNDPQLKHGYIAVPPITVTHLLQKTDTSMKHLLQQMHIVKDLLVLSDAVADHLAIMEKNFCILSYLSHTFDRLSATVFRDDYTSDIEANEENIGPPIPETEGVTFRKKLCWLLFLLAKQRFLGDSLELVHGFSVLLCCLEYVMRTTPSFLLSPPYDAIRIGCHRVLENGNISLLTKLAENFSASEDEVKELHTSCMEPFIQELLNRDGELDMDKLEVMYFKQHTQEGDLNEMLFLIKDPLICPSSPQSSNSTTSEGNTQSGQILTPVRATLYSIQQLKSTLATATDEPSVRLKEYFQACSNDPSSQIAERVRQMRDLFVRKFEEVTSSFQSVADPRYTLGIKLYYRMLELMLNYESKRLSQSVLNTLLNKDDFHRSLIACCLEVVLVAYGLSRSLGVNGENLEHSTFRFPWILNVLAIEPYDFAKVLEHFVKTEPKLPADIVKHLQHIEYKILEFFAWQEGSSLFDVINNYDRGMCTPPRNSPTEHPSSSNGLTPSAAEMFLSPVPIRPASSQVYSATSTSTTRLPSAPRRSTSLTAFFNKVYRLAYHRLQRLCSMLQLGKDLLQKIWTCFENCITYRLDLLKNRHIDQILMCSLYGVCKVADKEVRFKTIVQEYKNLPHAREEVFRRVSMDGGRFDSIIIFYNQIFMFSMKSIILQFANSRQAVTPLSPAPHLVSVQHSSPVYNLMGRKNFYISPLKESPFKAPQSPSQLTPSSRQLFCFGDRPGSAEKLRSINAAISAAGALKRKSQAGTSQLQKVRRKMEFDQPSSEDLQTIPEETKIVKKRAVLSPQKVSSIMVSETSAIRSLNDILE